MDRAELRRKEREDKKEKEQWMAKDRVNMAWYKGLPVSRKMFIGRFVEQEAIKNDNIVAMIMDKCILAAMNDNTDLSIILMKKIIKDYNDYILEYKEYLDKYGNGGMDMIENVKIREEVKGKMKKMIGEGVEKVKGMAILKKEYNLPAAELSELWIDCKVELDQNRKGKKIGVAIDPEKVNSLEIVNEVKVIKGQFGYYHKSKDGVRFSEGEKLINTDIAYKNMDEVEVASYKVFTDFNTEILALEEKLESIKKQRDLTDVKFKEIKQVFEM